MYEIVLENDNWPKIVERRGKVGYILSISIQRPTTID